MKSEQLQTAGIVLAAMLLGSGLTYFLVREKPTALAVSPASARDAMTSITPPPGKLGAQLRPQSDAIDDALFEAAVSRARAARKAGTLQPLATTPDQFAAALGALNYRIYDYTVRYATPPPDGSPLEAVAQKEMGQLLEELANLLSDDELLAKLEDSNPADLARSQSHLAAGALGLDAAATKRVEEILVQTYAQALPLELAGKPLTDEQEAEFDRKLEAMNEKMIAAIVAILTPEQKQRFEGMGADQVLFGLRPEDE